MSVNWSTMNFVFFKTHNCHISYISECFNAFKTKFLERKINFITLFHHITTIHLEDKCQQIRSMKSVNFFYAYSYCIKFHYIYLIQLLIISDTISIFMVQVWKSDNQILGSSVGDCSFLSMLLSRSLLSFSKYVYMRGRIWCSESMYKITNGGLHSLLTVHYMYVHLGELIGHKLYIFMGESHWPKH